MYIQQLSYLILKYQGSGKALRGKEGSMDEAVEAMSHERSKIFNAFALGLVFNLLTVMATCLIIMVPPMSYIALFIVFYTMSMIGLNAQRIKSKFKLVEAVKLDDLTNYNSKNTTNSLLPTRRS